MSPHVDGSILLPAAIRAAILEHVAAEAPLEACGLVLGDRSPFDGGAALRYAPARNALASPYRFEMDPRDLVHLTIEADSRGEAIWAIVHSHVRTEPRPSATDVDSARYPDALHLIVGPLDGASPPEVRAWRIAAEAVTEVPLRDG